MLNLVGHLRPNHGKMQMLLGCSSLPGKLNKVSMGKCFVQFRVIRGRMRSVLVQLVKRGMSCC
jgi:hypothetical protein